MSDSKQKVNQQKSIYEAVMQAGIAGAGGGGFPTHVKMKGKADLVIANGAECEPLLETDRHLFLREADKVVSGLNAAMEAVGATSGIIAVKRKNADIIALLTRLLQNQSSIRLFELDNFYPAGDEHVLVYEACGRVVPMGGIPLDVGVVVCNVYTLALIADSLKGKSFTHRYVTVTGEVQRPAVSKVPLGISIKDAINGIAGGITIAPYAIVIGGPMMGKLETDLDQPVIKTTGGILVLPGDHKLIGLKDCSLSIAFKRAKSACCQCTFCTEMCPRFLLGHKLSPHKIMRMLPATEENMNTESLFSAALCSECGLCGYFACTMGLAPNLVNGYLKGIMSKNNIKADFRNATMDGVNVSRDSRKVPTKRLTGRIGLAEYDRHLPFVEWNHPVDHYVLPLKQHTGAPSTAIVKPGDPVDAGDLIAVIPANALGVNLHSPVQGMVKEVSDKIVIETKMK